MPSSTKLTLAVSISSATHLPTPYYQKNFRVSTDKMNNFQARFGDFALVDLITGDMDVEILIPHVNKTVNNTITDTLTVELIDIR